MIQTKKQEQGKQQLQQMWKMVETGKVYIEFPELFS